MKSSWCEELPMLNIKRTIKLLHFSILAVYLHTFVLLWFSQASLDQPTQTVVMHRTEPTSLQNMALQLAEKLGGLVENNERVFDLKQGVYGGYFNRGSVSEAISTWNVLVQNYYFSNLWNGNGLEMGYDDDDGCTSEMFYTNHTFFTLLLK